LKRCAGNVDFAQIDSYARPESAERDRAEDYSIVVGPSPLYPAHFMMQHPENIPWCMRPWNTGYATRRSRMPEESKSPGDMLNDIAYRKQRAGQARFGRTSSTFESPKGVYLLSCEAIAQAFVGDDYRFSKSGPHFARRAGDYLFQVSFQSSRNNVADEYVALWIHANVVSPTVKKWRVTNRSIRGPCDFVAGGQIGNLAEHPSWLEWNLADSRDRQAELQNAIGTIRELALPYFAEFNDPTNICAKLKRGELVGMDLMCMFDFAACFSSLAAARDVAARFLSRRPSLLEEYRERMNHFRHTGLPDGVPSGWVDQLAALSIRFDLGDLCDAAVA
jgi:hypothetical protein